MNTFISRMIIGLLGAFCGCALATASAAEWEHVATEDGVEVYRRSEPDSSVVSLKGEANVAASVEELFEVLKDNERAGEWMPMVAKKETLKDLSADERIEVTHVAMPWPLTPRYFVNSARADRFADGGMLLSMKSASGVDHVVDGKVRGELYFSSVRLEPREPSKTFVTVEINSDPKGSIPTWLVNLAQRSWPVRFFTGLKAELEWKRRQAPLAH